METIFNFNPSDKELSELFAYDKKAGTLNPGFSVVPVLKEDYQSSVSENEAIMDIAQLLEYRNDTQAKEYWQRIPEIERQYRGGFDNQLTTSDI